MNDLSEDVPVLFDNEVPVGVGVVDLREAGGVGATETTCLLSLAPSLKS